MPAVSITTHAGTAHHLPALVRLTRVMCGLSAADKALYKARHTDTIDAMRDVAAWTGCAGRGRGRGAE